MHIIPHNLLNYERIWAHSCCLTPPHRSRTGTAGWGAWRMLRCVRERSRSSSPSQLWVAGPLSPYNVIIYLFILYRTLIIHSILCHDSSYVWDLVPAHLVIMFAPGSWCPETRVWHALSIVKQGASWLPPTSTTLGLFWTPHPTTTPSCRPAHRPPEAQHAT
jgi:hypothetical protein